MLLVLVAAVVGSSYNINRVTLEREQLQVEVEQLRARNSELEAIHDSLDEERQRIEGYLSKREKMSPGIRNPFDGYEVKEHLKKLHEALHPK